MQVETKKGKVTGKEEAVAELEKQEVLMAMEREEMD